jgi:hypothetical protein
MNPPLVEPAAAWVTAWPAWVAFGLLVVALALCWREARTRPGWPLVLLLLLATLARLIWIPAWGGHAWDGHEADYLEFFLGLREPTRGGTVLYPAMQWIYFLFGRLVDAPRALLLLSLAFSLLSIAILVSLANRLFGAPAGWIAGLFLALHGNHAFWSSSAYNVMLPFTLGLLSLWAVERLRAGGSPRLALLATSSGALAVACRMESVVFALPALVLLASSRPLRPLRWLPILLAGVLLSACAVLPLVWPGHMPGAGERGLAFPINVGLLLYLAPWDHPIVPALGLLALLPALGLPRAPVLALWALATGTHLVMASFDDYGYRHALPASTALLLLASGVIAALWRWGAGPLRRRLGRAGAAISLLIMLAASVHELRDVALRYYMSDADFSARLPARLPRLTPSDASTCVVIGEDPRISETPGLSHFNLLAPAEAESLRARQGCLSWCLDLQDARWSSRAVRDRALRLSHLYVLAERGVLTQEDTGYECLLLDVGARRRVPVAGFSWLPPPTPIP